MKNPVKLNLKKGDTVKVMTGNDRGKQGKILFVFPEKNKAIVEGINLVKKHQRAKSQTEQGGIISKESPINLSNLMIVCQSCHAPTRVKRNPDKPGERICARCGAVLANK
ncbi:50S ribosomal protein L24 [candidate division WOR-3 bacterium]|nr:50S ribosomal protein L24 [candidate division WOR-3 bacterium]